MRYRGFELYPFQEDAIRAIEADHSVIVSAPTGAGKTLIAEFAIEQAREQGKRIVYTSPIKALSNQKYRDFRERFGDDVGIMTGDVTLNPNAAVLIMTTEIFRNTIFEDSDRLEGIAYLIFDEVHYLGDVDRGSVWEESIIFAPAEIRFIALSATIGNLEELRAWMGSVREAEVDLVHTDDRPVPLHNYLYLEDVGIFGPRDLKENLRNARQKANQQSRRGRDRDRGNSGKGRQHLLSVLVDQKRMPILYFSFSRRRCETLARNYQRRYDLLDREQQRQVVRLFDDLVESYGALDHPAIGALRNSVRRGVLYHHAGMLPIFKDVVERLFTSGLVKLLFTTETFALGVNMPARCVIFDSLSKFDGVDMKHITPLEYNQMAGRAGRQGIDAEGEVYSMLDPRYDTPKRVSEILHKKPGAVDSRFSLGYSTVLNLQRLMGSNIDAAVEKSFAAFQRGSARRPLADVHRRVQVLHARGYVDDDGLTGKGRFCARINGFEIQLTELYWDGCFEELDASACAQLCAAIIYHPRRNAPSEGRGDTGCVPTVIVNRARKRVREFRRAETRAGVADAVKVLDFGIALPLEAWIRGAPFREMMRYGMQDGDLVRTFRLTIQVLRQLTWALPSDNSVAETCRMAIELLNRDEVDAEKQLRV